MTNPHKHADVIKAWAEGEIIQHFHMGRKEWVDCDPQWAIDSEYRVKPAKPAEPENVYPVSMIDGEELYAFLDDRSYLDTSYVQDLEALANHILRQACENGQIVTREEFDRAADDRAARDMAVAEAFRKAASDVGFIFEKSEIEEIVKRVNP